MPVSSDLFNETVHYLERHEETLRIKKLIFCLCKKYWENDLNVLNSCSLEDLVNELIQSKPSVEQLTFSMYKLVKTLNRPKVYATVAKAILDRLSSLYTDFQAEELDLVNVEPIYAHTQVSEPELVFKQIATNFANHQEESRIKKMVFAVCKNRWENNVDVINHYGFKDLIVELYEQYPTLGDLDIALATIVENINKKTLYLAISNIISKQLSLLYENFQEPVESAKEVGTQIYNTQIIQFNQAVNVPQPYSEPKPLRQSDYETSVIDITSEQMVTELKSVQIAPAQISPKTYDLFELRMEIVQYTNPLRAKILLFSLLFHPWDRSGQDWSMLRSYALDDLLEQLLKSGRPLSEIEAKLYETAKSLSDPETQLQVASTIIETIKFYL